MKDISYYKKLLEDEREKLKVELNSLGSVKPENPEDWDVKNPDIEVDRADPNEVADRAEELHIDSIVLDELELRYQNVVLALKKIDNNSFGTCEVDGASIEEDRLDANPAARTCKAHMGATESRLS